MPSDRRNCAGGLPSGDPPMSHRHVVHACRATSSTSAPGRTRRRAGHRSTSPAGRERRRPSTGTRTHALPLVFGRTPTIPGGSVMSRPGSSTGGRRDRAGGSGTSPRVVASCCASSPASSLGIGVHAGRRHREAARRFRPAAERGLRRPHGTGSSRLARRRDQALGIQAPRLGKRRRPRRPARARQAARPRRRWRASVPPRRLRSSRPAPLCGTETQHPTRAGDKAVSCRTVGPGSSARSTA